MVMLASFTALIEKTDKTMCVTLASTELAKCHNFELLTAFVSKAYPAMTVMNKTYLSLLCWQRRVFGHHP